MLSAERITRPSFASGSRRGEFVGEVVVETDAELGLDFLFVQHAVAQKSADHGAPEDVVIVQRMPRMVGSFCRRWRRSNLSGPAGSGHRPGPRR